MALDNKAVTRRELLRAVAAGGAAAAMGASYGDVTNRIQIERSTLRLPRWDADGFRVAVISDLHMDSKVRQERAIRALRMAFEERPDAILVPGDLISGSDAERLRNVAGFVDACGESSCPVLATMGNHDYWTPNPTAVIETIAGGSLRLLRNATVDIDGVTIAGIDDAIAGRHRPNKLQAGRESTSLLAMFHEPDFVSEVPTHISLQISGHSHGGQVCLPWLPALHTPRGARRYVDGYYPDARVPLFVSRGVGTTGPDYRLFCPPQVAVLTLQGA